MQPLAESCGQLEDAIVGEQHDDVARGVEHRGADLAGFKMLVDLGAQVRVHLAVDVGGDVLPDVLAVDPHLTRLLAISPALAHPNRSPRLGANPFNRGARLRCKSARAR